jgi:hypothetical protein
MISFESEQCVIILYLQEEFTLKKSNHEIIQEFLFILFHNLFFT